LQWDDFLQRTFVLGGAFPIAGMFGPPLAHSLDIFRAPEHVLVLGFAQPPTLTLSLAGLAAMGLGTKFLMPPVPFVGHEQLLAMQALAVITFTHAFI